MPRAAGASFASYLPQISRRASGTWTTIHMVSTAQPTPARAATPPTPVQTDAVVADSTDALVVDVSELSTWEQAVVAATTNDAAKLRALLTAEPGLRTLRVTAAS